MLMRSTPVSAMARTVCRVTPPDASSSTPGARSSRCARPAQLVHRHVVQQNDVRLAAQGRVEFLETLHFNFHGQRAAVLAGQADGLADAHAVIGNSQAGQVIVLDEDAVEEADAMIVAAAAAHRVFLQQPPAGRRLARSRIRARQPVMAMTKSRVNVATPLNCCRKSRAMRSADRMLRMHPETSANRSPFCTTLPSAMSGVKAKLVSTAQITSATAGSPATTPGCGDERSATLPSAAMTASLVTSPSPIPLEGQVDEVADTRPVQRR